MDDWQKQWWKQVERTAAEVEEFWGEVEKNTGTLVEEVSENVGSFIEQLQSGVVEEVDALIQDVVDIIVITSDEIDSALGEDWSEFIDDDFTNINYHPPSALNNPACINCTNYHGQSYNGNLLVCAMHPSGCEDSSCPDWSANN